MPHPERFALPRVYVTSIRILSRGAARVSSPGQTVREGGGGRLLWHGRWWCREPRGSSRLGTAQGVINNTRGVFSFFFSSVVDYKACGMCTRPQKSLRRTCGPSIAHKTPQHLYNTIWYRVYGLTTCYQRTEPIHGAVIITREQTRIEGGHA